MKWLVVEKSNPLAVHGIFDSLERAKRHVEAVIPEYVARGFFMDKSLQADSFKVVEVVERTGKRKAETR